MHCIEFRRILRTDPGSTAQSFFEHRRECSECSAEATRWVRFEKLLRKASKVDVPPDLASQVLVKQSFANIRSARAHRWRRRLSALAAGGALIAAIGWYWQHTNQPLNLSEEFVTLISQVPYALVPQEPVPPEAVSTALRPVGLKVDGALGEVTFASRCLVRGLLSGHVVLKGETAPVTVFLIPDSLVTHRSAIRSDHLTGTVIPTAGGTIAIVGVPGEKLDAIERQVLTSVSFPA